MAFAGNHVVNVHQTKNSHIIILAGFGETVTGVTSVIDPSGTYAFSAASGNGGLKLMVRIQCTKGITAKVKILDVVSTGDLNVTVTTSSGGTNGSQTIDVPVEFVDDSGA
jgi:hypothetical protein